MPPNNQSDTPPLTVSSIHYSIQYSIKYRVQYTGHAPASSSAHPSLKQALSCQSFPQDVLVMRTQQIKCPLRTKYYLLSFSLTTSFISPVIQSTPHVSPPSLPSILQTLLPVSLFPVPLISYPLSLFGSPLLNPNTPCHSLFPSSFLQPPLSAFSGHPTNFPGCIKRMVRTLA